jgi:hypothetical protein
VSERATRLLDGAVDLHVHPDPSPYPRRIGPLGAANHALETGMRAMALKSHHHCTAVDIALLRSEDLVPAGVDLIGGIVLNSQVGGLNPHAVALSLAMGGRIVWLPTISSPAHIAHIGAGKGKFPSSGTQLPPEPEIDVWDERGAVRPEVRELLSLIADADAVLASGHLPADSVVAVFELAHELGVRRMLVNHPNFIVEATTAQVARLVELGAYVEHASCMYDEHSRFRNFELPELVRWIKQVGPERTTLCSDLGQEGNPLPATSLGDIVDALHDEGFADAELRQMLADNPARLVGLDGLDG